MKNKIVTSGNLFCYSLPRVLINSSELLSRHEAHIGGKSVEESNSCW